MKEKDYYLLGEQEVSSNLKGQHMQMNVLRTKQVSHVGSVKLYCAAMSARSATYYYYYYYYKCTD